MSKRLGGIIGCKYKASPRHLNGFPDGSNIGLTNSIIPWRNPPLCCTLYYYIVSIIRCNFLCSYSVIIQI